MPPIYYKRLMFFAHFNAGVRALDIRDPFNPKEIGYLHPGDERRTPWCWKRRPARRRSCPTPTPPTRRAIQTNNVEVDDRGYIYIVDRANTGMHILELTGPARKIADWQAAATE